MRRFEFPMESVLRLRRFAEAEARQALHEAILLRDRAEAELESTRQRIATVTARLQDGLPDMAPAEVVYAWWELDGLEELALKQSARLAECEAEVDAKQQRYLAAQQERKPLERLKEELRREHYRQADLAEQNVSDEIAILSYSRKGSDP